jgi:hypoxanthine phosphoribosyltransferase
MIGRFQTMLDADQIGHRVRSLAAKIREDHEGEPLVAVVVLQGGFMFAADLLRALAPLDVVVSFLAVRSYEGTESSGRVEITHDLHADIAGRRVLLIEDIVDTGLTLRFLLDTLRPRHPATLRVATLLDKPSRRRVEIAPDYVGFTIPDVFVVGYGLDLDQRFRHLPHVATYDPDA